MSTRTLRWLIAASAAVALTAVAVAAVSLSSLAPGASEITGWNALQADKLAATASDLYKIYDGGDGPWKQGGVTSAFQRYYKNPTTKHVLTLVIHKCGSNYQTAKALYAKKNPAIAGQPGYATVQVSQQGALAKPTAGVSAHFWGKTYYCTVTVNGTSAADVSAAKAFMTAVAAKITKNG
jgi:hypothetical protein